jgi:hypothetical protein
LHAGKGVSVMKKRSESITEGVKAIRKKLDNLKSDTMQARSKIKNMQELNSLLTEDSRELAKLDEEPGPGEKG